MITAYKTHIGHTRILNEDRMFVQQQGNGFTLAIVADGMGGHQAGDVASQMAIDIISSRLRDLSSGLPYEAYEQQVRQAINDANKEVFELASTKREYQGMGTTIVLALATEVDVLIANIGDSRAYYVTSSAMTQVTEDHSLVNELVKSGQISIEEADDHPQRNVLTRALGTEDNTLIDFHRLEWHEGETLLLCSDGLSNYVEHKEIQELLNRMTHNEDKAELLITAALDAGGKDNITVVLVTNTLTTRDELR